MTYWNHRVIVHEDPEFGELTYAIHEVYYDDDGTITGWTQDPVGVLAETLDGMVQVLAAMSHAVIGKPVLVIVDDKLEAVP